MEQAITTAGFLPLETAKDAVFVIEFPDGSIATTGADDGDRPVLVKGPMHAFSFLQRHEPSASKCREKGGWKATRATDLQIFLGRFAPRFKGVPVA